MKPISEGDFIQRTPSLFTNKVANVSRPHPGAPSVEQAQQLASFRVALREFQWRTEAIARESGLTANQYVLLLLIKGAPDGSERTVAAVDFVTGNHQNILSPGEALRKIHIPLTALRKRHAHRRFTLTQMGRSTIFMTCASRQAACCARSRRSRS